jgi:hypothetical protein
MDELINRIFSGSQAKAIKELKEDSDCQRVLNEQIAKEFNKNDDILVENPVSQLTLIISESPFATSDNECVEVTKIVVWGLDKLDILPSIIEHEGQELAYRCLLSLSLFKEKMEKKWRFHGAPNPDFYREAGITSFHRIGSYEISEHFYQWEHFMRDLFKK